MTALVSDSVRRAPARLAGSAILACQSDDRLVKLVRSGHERAFNAIVDRYRASLVRFCRRILPESRCEDAVQQAFINAHAALTSSDEAVQLKPWLFTITRNAALNMLRQNGWNYEQIPLDYDGVRRPDQVFEQRIQLQQTVEALNDLPVRQREALVMREFEGRSYEEIALALGTGDGAVRQLLNRARGALRSAASALIPPPIVARAASSLPPTDGRRAAEILSSLGAAGVAKAGATVVVAGSLVVGAVNAPLPIVGSQKTTREKSTLVSDRAPAKASAAGVAVGPAQQFSNAASHGNLVAAGRRHGAGKQGGASHGKHGSSDVFSASPIRIGAGERDHSGTGSTEHSGSGDHHSGDGSRSGSDDHTTTTRTESSSGGSGTSGDSVSTGTSGSSDSGSITSGDTSGSSDTSPSAGTSGSSSGDTTTTTSTSGDTSSASGGTSTTTSSTGG